MRGALAGGFIWIVGTVFGHMAGTAAALVLQAWQIAPIALRWLGWAKPATGSSSSRYAEAAIPVIMQVAAFLAGSRHAHLREAWDADLFGDSEAGELPPVSRRLRLAAGDVVAAVRCRLDDVIVLGWRPVDALLGSWHGSRAAMVVPVTVAAGLVLGREGFYGLIANADNLGVIATAPYLAIKGLRKYRQIATPKRPEKTLHAGEPER
jgi:hypothetical protein